MSERIHEANCVIGVNGTGKSTYMREKIFPAYDLRTQKIVILSNTDPPPYNGFQRVDSIEKLQKMKHGIVKFYDRNFSIFEQLNELYRLYDLGYLRNGALVLEDCTKYIDSNPKREVKNFLIDHRMYDIDLYFLSHFISGVPPFMRKFMRSYTLFKTGDTFNKLADVKALKFPNPEGIWQAYCEVSREFAGGNKHAKRYVESGL